MDPVNPLRQVTFQADPSCFAQDQENMLADVQGDGDRQADNLPVLPTFHGDGEVTDKAQACREGGVLSFGGVISTHFNTVHTGPW